MNLVALKLLYQQEICYFLGKWSNYSYPVRGKNHIRTMKCPISTRQYDRDFIEDKNCNQTE